MKSAKNNLRDLNRGYRPGKEPEHESEEIVIAGGLIKCMRTIPTAPRICGRDFLMPVMIGMIGLSHEQIPAKNLARDFEEGVHVGLSPGVPIPDRGSVDFSQVGCAQSKSKKKNEEERALQKQWKKPQTA